MHPPHPTPHPTPVAVSVEMEMLEDKESCLTCLFSAQWSGNPGTGCGQRREAVGLGGETVECRAVVCLGEVSATAALNYEAAVDATSRDRRRALDSKRARDI